jgi:hypothetical protein
MKTVTGLAIIVLTVWVGSWDMARAQEAQEPQEAPPVAESRPAPLKGGVKGSVLLTEDGLNKMGEAIEELKTATTMVMGEVTRKQTTFVRGPNVIGPGIIIPALGGPSGTIPLFK